MCTFAQFAAVTLEFKGRDTTQSKIPPYRADVVILITQDADIALR